MEIVYAQRPFPDAWSKSIFLAGPTPRAGQLVPSWRTEALTYLRKMGFDGAVFVPEPEDGSWLEDYGAQISWEDQGLHFADIIVFWIPRDLDVLPGFTTNVEFGRWVDSHKVVLGHPPGAPKTRYLDALYQETAQQPVLGTLPETLAGALARLGAGSLRSHGERHVPLHVWTSRFFRAWYEDLCRAGNRLDDARVRWVYFLPQVRQVLAGILWVKVWVEAEQRHKSNEWIFGRTDLHAVLLYERPRQSNVGLEALLKTEVVLIREFRSPARTVDGFVHELPGGSSLRPDQDPREVAAQEVREETGLNLALDRFIGGESRPAAATVSTHHCHLHAAALTPDEMGAARQAAHLRTEWGDRAQTELTTVEIATIEELLRTCTVDWSTLGMVMKVLYDWSTEN